MNILLTGHEGYLGSRLFEYLQEKGHAVIGLGREQDLKTITRDRLDKDQVELVVNCAAAADRVHTTYLLEGPDEQVNVFGTRQLVQALEGTNIGLIHLSTKDVYGEVYTPKDIEEIGGRLIPGFAVDESQPFRPQTIYAKTKLMGEFIAESHPKTAIIRLSTGYTSHPHRRGNWILHFCRAAKAGNAVHINGSGKQLRDPVHADDLGALILLLHEKNAWGTKLNVGGGPANAYSILEVLDRIHPQLARKFSDGGDLGYVSDIALARKLVGWEPVCSFPQELDALIQCIADE